MWRGELNYVYIMLCLSLQSFHRQTIDALYTSIITTLWVLLTVIGRHQDHISTFANILLLFLRQCFLRQHKSNVIGMTTGKLSQSIS